MAKLNNMPHDIDYSQITDQIYIGSDLCNGLVCPIHGEEFKKLGICGEINLEEEHPETPPKNLDAYLWLPVIDKQAPRLDQLLLGSAVIKEMVLLDNKIYIHCRNGHGRSPTLVAAYLMRYQKMTARQAVEFIKSKRSQIHIEGAQTKALEEFEAQCK